MRTNIPLQICSQTVWLSPGRSLFWEEESCLVIADLHYGKTGHFRKSGIPVPQQVNREDLIRLIDEISHFKPKRLVLCGDLFHSHENLEHAHFARWREDMQVAEVHLVKGNHDILRPSVYADLRMEVHEGALDWGPFRFVHDPAMKAGNDSSYTIAGHIHPGIRISGLGRQSLRLPCFFFGTEGSILPAFSRFTGLALMDPEEGRHVIAVVPAEPQKNTAASLVRIK